MTDSSRKRSSLCGGGPPTPTARSQFLGERQSRWRTTPLAVVLLAACLAFSACGDNPAQDADRAAEKEDAPKLRGPLAPVEKKLAAIESGQVDAVIRANTPGQEPLAFEMHGTFAAATSEDALPVADLKYVDRSGDSAEESGFVSDGKQAWVITAKGGPKLVKDAQLDGLKGGEDVAGLRGLHPTKWFSGEIVQAKGQPSDGDTTSYTGPVDVAAFFNDILPLSANLGAYVAPEIDEKDFDRVRDAARNATLEVVAGADSNEIHKITFGVDLEGDPDQLRDVLRELSANRVELELTLTGFNDPIETPARPEGAPSAA